MSLPPDVLGAVIGATLGAVAGLVSFLGLVGAANLILPPEKRPPPTTQNLLLLALFFKLPLLAVGAQISLEMGPSGLSAFGLSIVSVYSAAVGFLHWKSQKDNS